MSSAVHVCVVDKGQNNIKIHIHHHNTISNIRRYTVQLKILHSKILRNRFIHLFGGEKFLMNSHTITKFINIFSSTKIVLHGILQYTMWCGFSKEKFL